MPRCHLTTTGYELLNFARTIILLDAMAVSRWLFSVYSISLYYDMAVPSIWDALAPPHTWRRFLSFSCAVTLPEGINIHLNVGSSHQAHPVPEHLDLSDCIEKHCQRCPTLFRPSCEFSPSMLDDLLLTLP